MVMYNNSNIPDNLFILKHKDLDVTMVSIDLSSGKIEHILDIYLPDELPVGCDNQKMNTIISWWESRAIPDSRRGIQQVLHYLNENSNLSQERSEQIARTINTKLEYLRLYQQGKKIWKAEKYW